MSPRVFAPGFRLSALDVVVLVIGSVAAGCVGWFVPHLGAGIGFVVLHFFLFCNVFRIARTLELSWAGWFLLLAVCAALWQWPNWSTVALLSLAATAVVIGLEMRKASYHGVGWRWINPGLEEWFRNKS